MASGYNIKEIQEFLDKIPSFQKHGRVAYKPGVESMREIDDIMGNPSKKFKAIHIAGTNGKGSTSHIISSALMQLKKEDGTPLKVGLYTSPHLVDYRERVKVNGKMVPVEFVYDFIARYKDKFETIGASYFEITTALAFDYFAFCSVDIAVIECGLGGRLDSTNIIDPLMSVITNIGLDHCEHLGYSLPQIAREKGGIIKESVPVVIGERGDDDSVKEVFEKIASQKGAKLFFAQEYVEEKSHLYEKFSSLDMDLKGDCQEKNLKTVFCALYEFLGEEKFTENMESILQGVKSAAANTGLMGRWQILQQSPLVICDTGHNAHGIKIVGAQIKKTYLQCKEKQTNSKLYVIYGVVADKDLASITDYLPKEQAHYFYVNAPGPRSLDAKLLQQKMEEKGFVGSVCEQGDIFKTMKQVLELSTPDDFIFVGGSTFVVAEVLKFYNF